MTVNEAYNFKKFTERIDTAGVVSEPQLRALSEEDYTAVVNLLPEDSEYALPNERKIVESQGLRYRYIPVDFSVPTKNDYEQFESAMRDLPKGKALLHCAANYRVSAFVSIYAYRNLDWSAEEARQFIAGIWDIREHPAWKEFVIQWLSE